MQNIALVLALTLVALALALACSSESHRLVLSNSLNDLQNTSRDSHLLKFFPRGSNRLMHLSSKIAIVARADESAAKLLRAIDQETAPFGVEGSGSVHSTRFSTRALPR